MNDVMSKPQPRAGQAPGTGQRIELAVEGMTCGGCVKHVTAALEAVPGVTSAQVELEPGRARIETVTGAANGAAELIEAVEAAGYQARPWPDAPAAAIELSVEGMTPLVGRSASQKALPLSAPFRSCAPCRVPLSGAAFFQQRSRN